MPKFRLDKQALEATTARQLTVRCDRPDWYIVVLLCGSLKSCLTRLQDTLQCIVLKQLQHGVCSTCKCAQHAMCQTCNLLKMQMSYTFKCAKHAASKHAMCRTCNVPNMQCAEHAVCRTCNVPNVQMCRTCIVPNMQCAKRANVLNMQRLVSSGTEP